MTGFCRTDKKFAKLDNNSFHTNRNVPVDWLDIATAMYIHKSQAC